MTAVVRVGWIGTGVMGAPMCAHLLSAGHEVTAGRRRLAPGPDTGVTGPLTVAVSLVSWSRVNARGLCTNPYFQRIKVRRHASMSVNISW